MERPLVWSALVGEVGRAMVGVTFLGLRARLHRDRGFHRFLRKGCRKLLNAFQVKRVVQLEGENELMQLHLAIAAGEDSRASRDGQVGVLVGDVSPLEIKQTKHGYIDIYPRQAGALINLPNKK